MQFVDLVFKFLKNLGYPEGALLKTSIAIEDDEEADEALESGLLVLSPNGDQVIAAMLLAPHRDSSLLAEQAAGLARYCASLNTEVAQFMIALDTDVDDPNLKIAFYECEEGGSFAQIPLEDFPEYSDLVLEHTLHREHAKTLCEANRQKSLRSFAYLVALVFILVAVGDVYVERMLEVSYLNAQRALLLIAAAVFLFLPRFFRNDCKK
ncbi:MAG: hypothetical protein KDJ38_18580 [Gammaproteobacteria bacterium]|nr:hypothetical protein [Gammaproteobacteria bacterium]